MSNNKGGRKGHNKTGGGIGTTTTADGRTIIKGVAKNQPGVLEPPSMMTGSAAVAGEHHATNMITYHRLQQQDGVRQMKPHKGVKPSPGDTAKLSSEHFDVAYPKNNDDIAMGRNNRCWVGLRGQPYAVQVWASFRDTGAKTPTLRYQGSHRFGLMVLQRDQARATPGRARWRSAYKLAKAYDQVYMNRGIVAPVSRAEGVAQSLARAGLVKTRRVTPDPNDPFKTRVQFRAATDDEMLQHPIAVMYKAIESAPDPAPGQTRVTWTDEQLKADARLLWTGPGRLYQPLAPDQSAQGYKDAGDRAISVMLKNRMLTRTAQGLLVRPVERPVT